MRPLFLVVILAASLAACSDPAPPAAKDAATPVAAAPAKPADPAASKPAEPAKLPEVGTCGDQSAVPADQRIANTPRWTLASQQDTFGFDVYRGDAEEGPFARVTPKPVLGAGTTDETHKYEFRDDTIDPCKAYWYYVEEISTSGSRSKFTPVFRAGPKRRAADTAH
jgi:hypothetical protein